MAKRELEKIKARGGPQKDQAQREWENKMREQQEAREALEAYKSYKPDVNIAYTDEFGRGKSLHSCLRMSLIPSRDSNECKGSMEVSFAQVPVGRRLSPTVAHLTRSPLQRQDIRPNEDGKEASKDRKGDEAGGDRHV